MFDQTDADIPGELLRLPFASFALVFSDRHFLGIAERMLAIEEKESTVTGQALRNAAVYVRDEAADGGRAIRVTRPARYRPLRLRHTSKFAFVSSVVAG